MSQPKPAFALPAHYSLISAQLGKEHDQVKHEALANDLKALGFGPIEVQGHYGYPEKSYLVPHEGKIKHHKQIDDLGRKYGQQSVLHSSDGFHELRFTDHSPSHIGEGMVEGQHLADYYTELPDGRRIQLNVAEQPKAAGPVTAAVEAHQAEVGEKVKKSELEKSECAHPHLYDWHDDGEELEKKEDHPHLDAHGKILNEQAGGNESGLAEHILGKYGTLSPGKKTSLNFYGNIQDAEPKIDAHLTETGHTPYFAGGKYGPPDLQNKNYKTKHLMIYDPTPSMGGDFGDEALTRSWRKIHEKAHADTYADINAKYGEGRRLGKLGNRTLREMKRAVEWEHHAVHKQRELLAGMGHHISDQDFAREYNTVMGDSVHRAITGKFTDPGDMGFAPHDKMVPLEHSLSILDEHAKKLGLRHENDTLQALHADKKSPLEKAKIIDFKSGKTLADLPSDTAGKSVALPRDAAERLWMYQGNDEWQHYEDNDRPKNHIGKEWADFGYKLAISAGDSVRFPRKLAQTLYDHHAADEIEHYQQNEGGKDHIAHDWMKVGKALGLKKSEQSDRELLKSKLLEFRRRTAALKTKAVSVRASELQKADADSCDDCGDHKFPCQCFGGLAAPEVKLEKGKITLLFKSEWSEDQREACLDQFKRRAKQVIREKYGR